MTCSLRSIPMTLWTFIRSVIRVDSHQAARIWRRQSTLSAPGPSISPTLLGRARALAAEHTELSRRLNSEYDTKLAKKAGALSAVAEALKGWESANNSLPELQQLVQDQSTDAELRSLAEEEIASTREKLAYYSKNLQTTLVPQHPFADMSCLIEIRPGAGGDEAALFAGDLLRMYRDFCKRKGLHATLLKLDSAAAITSEDMIQEAILEIDAPGTYDVFRCEAGVHRVQRVPATEIKGRTHTSAVSVMVLPNLPDQGGQNEETDFDDPTSDYYIDPKDVRTDVMRARGAGGQHVNTTDSAVRLTHLPTNTVVAMQDSRSQHKNRAKAWQLLRAKLAQARRDAREEEIAQLRISVVGVARMGRENKVRTYNWGQQRVTDHRSGITVHNLHDILEGGDSLDKVMNSVKEWLKTKDIEALIADEEAEKMKIEEDSKKANQHS